MGLFVIPVLSPFAGLGDLRTTIVVSECILDSFCSVLGVPGFDAGSHASTNAAVLNGIPMLFNFSAKLPSDPMIHEIKLN